MSGVARAAAVESTSPWRQPILWLVFALPAAMVVAGVFLVRSAIGLGSLDASSDRVERTAQVQTTDLTADLVARDAGLAAVLICDDGFIRVQALTGDFPRGQPLSLLLQHPIDTRADRVLVLQPDGEGWSAPFEGLPTHDWKLELRPATGDWRLHGRWLRTQASARLQPALRAMDHEPIAAELIVGHCEACAATDSRKSEKLPAHAAAIQ